MFLERRRELNLNDSSIRSATNLRVVATMAETAFSRSARRRGLLGRDELPAGHALVLAPCYMIHTWFMRFAIDVLFVTQDGRVVKTCQHLVPGRVAAAWGSYAVIEMAAGSIEQADVKIGDTLEIVFPVIKPRVRGMSSASSLECRRRYVQS